MIKFRKYTIFMINAIVLLWILKAAFFDGAGDVIQIFLIASVVFLLIFNIYASLLYSFFPRESGRPSLREASYYLLLILPIVFLVYLISRIP